MHVIILNGPPGSGKDTLAEYLVYRYAQCVHLKFSAELKNMVHRMYALKTVGHLELEMLKDTPQEELFGLTPRQAYIGLSELYIKNVHGKDFFGKLLAKTIKATPQHKTRTFIVSDGGFIEEILSLTSVIDAKKITVVQIHRPGCTFKDDSRSYLDKDLMLSHGVETHTLYNLGEKIEFLRNCEMYFKQWNLIKAAEAMYI